METHQNVLTSEQDEILTALVRIAHVVGYQRKLSFEDFERHLRFLVNCLCVYWEIEASPEAIKCISRRVLEIANEQKNDMLAEFRKRGMQA